MTPMLPGHLIILDIRPLAKLTALVGLVIGCIELVWKQLCDMQIISKLSLHTLPYLSRSIMPCRLADACALTVLISYLPRS